MHPFDFAHASEVAPAITSGARDGAKFIAGGTNLVDLMKCNVEKPSHVVEPRARPDRERWRAAVERSRAWLPDLSALDF